MNQFLLIIAVISFAFSTLTVSAQEYHETSGRNASAGSIVNGLLKFDWDAKIAVDTLLGEPVVSVRFRYKNLRESLGVVPELHRRSGGIFSSARDTTVKELSTLPKAALLGPRLYQVKMLFKFAVGGNSSSNIVYLSADVGVPAKGDGQTWSYNTPGSPAWGELFTSAGSKVTATRAKEFLKSGLTLKSAKIVSAEVSWLELQKWYLGESRQADIDRLLEAEKLLEAGIERSYGFDVRKTDPRSVTAQTYRLLERHVDRLSRLPEHIRIGDNHGPYLAALALVKKQAREFSTRKESFKFSEPDVNAMAQGKAPQLDVLATVFPLLKVKAMYRDELGNELSDSKYFIVDGADNAIAGPIDIEGIFEQNVFFGEYIFTRMSEKEKCKYVIKSFKNNDFEKVIDTSIVFSSGKSYEYYDCNTGYSRSNELVVATGVWGTFERSCKNLLFGRCGTLNLLTCTVFDSDFNIIRSYNSDERDALNGGGKC